MTGHYKRGMGLAIMIAFGNFLGCAYSAFPRTMNMLMQRFICSDDATHLPSARCAKICTCMQVPLYSALFSRIPNHSLVLTDSIEIMYPCLGIISVSLAVLVYSRLNAKQTKRMRVPETLTVELVDGQLRPAEGRAPDFRYIL